MLLRGGPEGVAGIADGRYNANTELLKNVTPYSMPKQGSLNANKGPQAARRVAADIPPVELPEPDALAESTFSVFHSVDNGDIAFIVKPVASQKYVWLSSKPYQMQTNKRFDSCTDVDGRKHFASSTVAELLLVCQLAKGLEVVIGLLFGDQENQAQEFSVHAARGRHACRQECHLTIASLGVAILANLDGSGVPKDRIRLVRVAQLAVVYSPIATSADEIVAQDDGHQQSCLL